MKQDGDATFCGESFYHENDSHYNLDVFYGFCLTRAISEISIVVFHLIYVLVCAIII